MAKKDFLHPVLKGFLGGIVIITLISFVSPDLFSLGLHIIDRSFNGQISWYLPFAKILATSSTIAFGGSGGLITPIFFIGSSSGNILGHLMDMNVTLFAALGFVSILSGAANTPITSIILAAELFGADVAHYAAITAIISFLISSNRCICSSEVISTIEEKFNKEFEKIE